MIIRPYQQQDQSAVIALWETCGLIRPWNDPIKDIARKLTVQPELFLVAVTDGQLVGSAMIGYDGHRGWVNYLAVSPDSRRLAYGKQLMQKAERLLLERGCPKLNLQVRTDNHEVIEFYRKLGYSQDPVVSLGKRLITD
jgi:ribosomal protein S18 acetylase RimI-like enzyme